MVKRKGRPQGVVVRAGGGAASGGGKPAEAAPAADADAPVEAQKLDAVPTGHHVAGPPPKKRKKMLKRPPAPQQATPAAPAAAEAAAAAAEPPPSPIVVESGSVAPPAGDALAWLVWPQTPATFFKEYWEKKPLHLRRARPEYHGDVFSRSALQSHLKGGTPIAYGERINIARFDAKAGKKVDLNKGPRGTPATAEDIDAFFDSGASLQVMHMQQFHEPVWRLLASLERSFSALFGANAYITPGGGCQGLAPHYDDVEVFMLQLEGSKRWRLWEPPDGEEFPLPREYSRDFLPSELGTPVLDIVLERGDMLYLPRGFVHAGVAEQTDFSHHLTVSTYQRLAWCQLLERALSTAVERAADASPEFREGLPVGFLRYMGSWYDRNGVGPEDGPASASAPRVGPGGGGRLAFFRKFRGLFRQLQDFVDLDEVCDSFGVEFTVERLPPPYKAAAAGTKVELDSRLRWVDPSAVRAMLSTDEDTGEVTIMLFHSCNNDRTVHMVAEAEDEVGCLRFEAATFLPALRALLALEPAASMRCGDLPLKEESDRIALCENLLEAKLLVVVQEEAKSTAT